jgi:hypothetical protein
MSAGPRSPVLLAPGEGRSYPMGRISALFKADGDETGGSYLRTRLAGSAEKRERHCAPQELG